MRQPLQAELNWVLQIPVSQGFGEEEPVATSATAGGRHQNHRVALVVKRQSIGSQENTSATAH